MLNLKRNLAILFKRRLKCKINTNLGEIVYVGYYKKTKNKKYLLTKIYLKFDSEEVFNWDINKEFSNKDLLKVNIKTIGYIKLYEEIIQKYNIELREHF